MTVEKIKALLSRLNVPENEVVQIPELRTIIMTTNQGLDYRRDFLIFDTKNGLLKIKQYSAKGAAGRITNDFTMIDSKTMKSKHSISYCHPKYSFKKIESGDILFTVEKKTGKIKDIFEVEFATNEIIKLKSDLHYDITGEILCFTTKENYTKMIQDKIDKSLFLIYTPYSNNKADIYLDFGYILGFEAQSPLVGLS